ncbi:hypothetical protein [Caulobacter sp. LARHSG274]
MGLSGFQALVQESLDDLDAGRYEVVEDVAASSTAWDANRGMRRLNVARSAPRHRDPALGEPHAPRRPLG